MKRVDLIKAIESFGCHLVRHGGRHDWYRDPIPHRISIASP
jgi:mRNA interferase HicA